MVSSTETTNNHDGDGGEATLGDHCPIEVWQAAKLLYCNSTSMDASGFLPLYGLVYRMQESQSLDLL